MRQVTLKLEMIDCVDAIRFGRRGVREAVFPRRLVKKKEPEKQALAQQIGLADMVELERGVVRPAMMSHRIRRTGCKRTEEENEIKLGRKSTRGHESLARFPSLRPQAIANATPQRVFPALQRWSSCRAASAHDRTGQQDASLL